MTTDLIRGFGAERKLVRLHRDQIGVAMVEFALVVPVLLLFLVGITDFGRAVYYKNTLENAAREGARAGIVLQGSDWALDGNLPGIDSNPAITTAVYTSAQSYLGTNTIVGRAAATMAGLDLNEVKVTVSAPWYINRTMPLTVRIEYTYRPATSFIGVPNIPLVAESTMRIE